MLWLVCSWKPSVSWGPVYIQVVGVFFVPIWIYLTSMRISLEISVLVVFSVMGKNGVCRVDKLGKKPFPSCKCSNLHISPLQNKIRVKTGYILLIIIWFPIALFEMGAG